MRWRVQYDARGEVLDGNGDGNGVGDGNGNGNEDGVGAEQPVVWRSYMFEALGGSVPPRGALLSVEGAKVCVPLVVVVPPSASEPNDRAHATMCHFGTYEPHLGWDLDDADRVRLYKASFANSVDFLMKAVLLPACRLAAERGVRPVLYAALSRDNGHARALETAVFPALVLDRGFKVVRHAPSYMTGAAGDTGLVHATVDTRGCVDMVVARFDLAKMDDRDDYFALSLNQYVCNGCRMDGATAPGSCVSLYVRLPPLHQRFVHLDAGAPDDGLARQRAQFWARLLGCNKVDEEPDTCACTWTMVDRISFSADRGVFEAAGDPV
jgi:hypothetical protein